MRILELIDELSLQYDLHKEDFEVKLPQVDDSKVPEVRWNANISDIVVEKDVDGNDILVIY